MKIRLLSIALMALGIAGCARPSSPATTGQASTSAKPDLELLDAKQTGSDITGSVRNNSSKSFKFAEVSITLLDSSGSVVSMEQTQVKDLGPGQTGAFDAPTFGNKFASFKITDVKGY